MLGRADEEQEIDEFELVFLSQSINIGETGQGCFERCHEEASTFG
jgi:hypothetical protein